MITCVKSTCDCSVRAWMSLSKDCYSFSSESDSAVPPPSSPKDRATLRGPPPGSVVARLHPGRETRCTACPAPEMTAVQLHSAPLPPLHLINFSAELIAIELGCRGIMVVLLRSPILDDGPSFAVVDVKFAQKKLHNNVISIALPVTLFKSHYFVGVSRRQRDGSAVRCSMSSSSVSAHFLNPIL